MQPSRILPDLQCSLLCEDLRQETSGNFILIGVLNVVRVPQLPVTAYKIVVFNRWTAGVGQFTESIRLIAPDQTTVLRKTEVKFALQEGGHIATNVSVLGQVEFAKAGAYWIEVLVDDVMKLRYPLPVMIVQQPPQPGAAPKPPQ
jgi:ribosomal protein S16